MQSFKAALINEIERMLKRKKAIVISILTLLVVAVYQVIILFFKNQFKIQLVNASGFTLSILDVMINFLLPLFVTLVVIDSFAGEYHNNTIKISLLKPITRFKLYAAKVLSCLFFVVFSLSVSFILSFITGLIFSSRIGSISSILNAILAYILALIPFTVLILAISMLSHFFKSPVAVFFTCALIYIAIGTAGYFISFINTLAFTSNMKWYTLFTTNKIPWQRAIIVFLQLLGSGIMFFAIGYSNFEKVPRN